MAIDDDTEFLELVNHYLDVGGFEVFTASNGPEGLKIASKKGISVILLDTVMPGMDGLEVLSKLKKNKKTKNIPIFMLTAKSAIGDLDYAFEIGADDYITKPVAIRELADKVKFKLDKVIKVYS